MSKDLSGFRISAFFIISITLIAYELAVMRSFAVGSWSNFGSMVISIALLGNGLAGTLLTFFSKRISRNINRWLIVTSVLPGPSMSGAYILAQYVPFNPVMIAVDWTQFASIGFLVVEGNIKVSEFKPLLQFLNKTSFEACYYPGILEPEKNFNTILKGYTGQFLIPEDLYYFTVDWLLKGKARELYGKYFFNIRPVTDNRPYYTGYVKPLNLPVVLKNMTNLSEEWGYVLQIKMLSAAL